MCVCVYVDVCVCVCVHVSVSARVHVCGLVRARLCASVRVCVRSPPDTIPKPSLNSTSLGLKSRQWMET